MAQQAQHRTIVITGCSSGFGRVTALHLAQRGWRVFATVRREADQANLLVEALSHGLGERLIPVLCDIVQADQVRHLAQLAGPRLDALLNNAGTAFPGPLELISLDEFRAQLEVNVTAHLGVTQALLPALKAAQGVILNVSSQGGRVVFPMMGAYHASKFALEGASEALRIELAPFGVRVVVLQPGSSATPIWATGRDRGLKALETYGPAAAPYQRLVHVMLKRVLERQQVTGFPPEDLARLVERILATPRPRARYALPARTAWLIRLRALLPDEWWLAFVRRMLKW